MRKVVVVGMSQGDSLRPAVKARGREDAIGKIMFKVSVFTEEGA
jgi:hypothetical protein